MLFRRKDCTPSGMIVTLVVMIILGLARWALLKG